MKTLQVKELKPLKDVAGKVEKNTRFEFDIRIATRHKFIREWYKT